MDSQRIWNFWASRYDSLWVQKFSLRPSRELVTSHVAKLAEHNRGLSILDMGCGTGQQYEDLRRLPDGEAFSYTGVDLSGEMINSARVKYPEAHFMVCDVAGFKAPEAAFDVIICSHSFPYYDSADQILSTFVGLLKPSGVLLLAQACKNSLYDRLVLTMVSWTTSRAQYRSLRRMEAMGRKHFRHLSCERISETLFMPSLYLFRWTK